jgi:uncharacterized protein
MARLNYVEIQVGTTQAAKSFYQQVFGWDMTDYGPDYASTTSNDVDIGLDASGEARTPGPLPVIAVDDLEATLAAVIASGGIIVQPIFAFPGGRRFHFTDVDGNLMAAWVMVE